jgi:KDO2-lipid IV(A) lauroyltransferase
MSAYKKLRFYLELAGVKLVQGLVRLLPVGAAISLGAFIGWKAYRLFRIRRRVSIANIERSLDLPAGGGEADRIACASYMNLGRSMMEFASFRRLQRERILDMVDFVGKEAFDEALAARRGAILFTGHFGNWELVGAAVAAYGYPIRVLVGRQSNPLVDRVINDLRRSQVPQIIRREAGLKKVFRALDNNEFVAMVADQDARRDGVFVDFLGRAASTAKGPALFAVRRGSPVIAGFIRRSRHGKHIADLRPPMWPNPSLAEEDAVVDLVQRYTNALADAIREFPTEYFWAHRRWKTSPSKLAEKK